MKCFLLLLWKIIIMTVITRYYIVCEWQNYNALYTLWMRYVNPCRFFYLFQESLKVQVRWTIRRKISIFHIGCWMVSSLCSLNCIIKGVQNWNFIDILCWWVGAYGENHHLAEIKRGQSMKIMLKIKINAAI